MFIRTNDDHKIVEVIIVGVKPKKNGYEIDSIPEDVLKDILNYKYIDGQFVKSSEEENTRNKYIEQIRAMKLQAMSDTCGALINAGIDYGDEHYSLNTTDQINLMKLESVARFSPNTPILYHADGKECRVYSNDEILNIANRGIGLITYHTTYHNQLKAMIKKMTNVDDIINVKYGMKLDDVHDAQFKALTSGIEFPMDEIEDTFDYESLIPKVDQDMIDTVMKSMNKDTDDTIKVPMGIINEPWKPSTQPFVREDELIIEPYEPSDDFPIDEPVDEEPPTDVESGEPYENEDTPTDGEAE